MILFSTKWDNFMFAKKTQVKSGSIYQSTGRTGEDKSVEAQLRKARTDFEVLKQTPYIVGGTSPANNSRKASIEHHNSGRVNISGEESDNSEEYDPFDPNEQPCPW